MRKLHENRLARLIAHLGFVLAVMVMVPATAAAHEIRTVGPNGEYTLVIGWFNEPAFNNVPNGVDIQLVRTADKKPVNTEKGDVVDLQVEVQFRAGEDEKAAVLESVTLPNKPSITMGTQNRYATWFMPVRAGAYAFRISGKISDVSDPKAGAVTLDETFVCGKGSKGHHAFVCLAEPLVFPSAAAK